MAYDKRITDLAAQAALAAGKNASVAPQLLLADITFVLADAIADGRLLLPDALTKQQHGDEVVEALELALATFRASSMRGRPVNVTMAVYAIERALKVCAGE